MAALTAACFHLPFMIALLILSTEALPAFCSETRPYRTAGENKDHVCLPISPQIQPAHPCFPWSLNVVVIVLRFLSASFQILVFSRLTVNSLRLDSPFLFTCPQPVPQWAYAFRFLRIRTWPPQSGFILQTQFLCLVLLRTAHLHTQLSLSLCFLLFIRLLLVSPRHPPSLWGKWFLCVHF